LHDSTITAPIRNESALFFSSNIQLMAVLPRVVIADLITDSLEPERRVLADIAEVVAANGYCEADLIGKVEDAAAIMLYHNLGLTRSTIERLRSCKLIVRCGVGYDNVDRAFARAQGIAVCNVPDYGTEDVADSAIGMLLSLVRGISFFNTFLRDTGREWTFTHAGPRHRLRGRTLGIVGLGRIGTATALRAKVLGLNVAFYDPYVLDGYDKALGLRRAETLDELLHQSHAISLHCPLTDETRHMINEETIAMLPRGAYLINTSRGAVVDTSAIPAALASGQLVGAAIDVLEREPPSNDHPLLLAWRDPSHPAHHRLILNPHCAFYSEEGVMDMRTKGAETCRRALLGFPLRNVVN
jgi:D-3-phosphoglycerate dehydrogenase/C-terminal binding protein